MINKRLFLTLTLLFTSVFLNCTGANIMSTYGVLPNTNPTRDYANVPYGAPARGGLVYHNDTMIGQLGTNADTSKMGEACSHSVLYLVSWGDSSIDTARKAGKITKIGAVDYNQTGFFAGILYHSFCTRVYGQSETTVGSEVAKEPVKKNQGR